MMKMERHKFWRQQYRINRYLFRINENDLVQRGKDILCNMLVLNEQRKIGLLPLRDQGEYWLIAWTHILEECSLRNYKYPEPFAFKLADTQIPKPNWPGIEKAIEIVKAKNLIPDSFLIKYGKRQYLENVLKQGRVLINPASFYKDSSLNAAIKDNELELSVYLDHPIETINLEENSSDLRTNIKSYGSEFYNFKMSTNFYAYCLSTVWSLRLFGDFESDCCLVINHPQEFIEKLAREVTNKLQGWRWLARGITYIDPLNIRNQKINIPFCKHFRFTYQKEYRIVWYPPDSQINLNSFFVELKNLGDICDLISL